MGNMRVGPKLSVILSIKKDQDGPKQASYIHIIRSNSTALPATSSSHHIVIKLATRDVRIKVKRSASFFACFDAAKIVCYF
jgi:hypothetical protein